MDWTKLWPEISGGIILLTDTYHAQISAYIAGHPKIAMWAALIVAIASKFGQSPLPPKTGG